MTQTDEKQVAEDYIAQFDYSVRLLPGEFITNVVSVIPVSEGLVPASTLVTISSIAHDGVKLAQAKVSAGTHKEKYLLTCLVVTNKGSTLECEMYLVVRNKP